MRFLVGLFTLLFLATPGFSQTYYLAPGDVISVEVLEDASLNRNTLVLPDGTISFPFAGNIRAQGRTVSQVEAALKKALAPNFATSPTVFVSVNSLNPGAATANSITIYVVGQVNNPGPILINGGLNFLQALASVGGFTPFAATKRVQLRRINPANGQEVVYKYNLKAVGNGAPMSGNTIMREGDIIFVPERRLFE